MAESSNLIDFDVIETHKENIQSLPSGRSAKSLAVVLSPLSLHSPSQTHDANIPQRQAFEAELASIDESDDPLDIYDRYVKWTLSAYPSAQATPQSQLLPLLERATCAFLSSPHYKNDPRYLRLWLHHIRFFADAPRETFAYLARHGVGEGLALFYEEFAAWLERAGRWAQAGEVYGMGVGRGARPAERLARKFAEFQERARMRPQEGAGEPTSPALPTVRPALAAKVDPFAIGETVRAGVPQQVSRRAAAQAEGSKKAKLAIFADEVEEGKPISSGGSKGWENIGTVVDRKKENAIGPRPWVGETLRSGTVHRAEPKMAIFKDQSTLRTQIPDITQNHPANEQKIVNQRTGKLEYVAVNLDAVYPDPKDPTVEVCFEELRAARRGWLQKDWRAQRGQSPEPSDQFPSPLTFKPAAAASSPSVKALQNCDNREVNAVVRTFSQQLKLNDVDEENDENRPPDANAKQQKIERARKMRRDEKANETRLIKVREAKTETQTIQTNLDSPRRPRIKRKRSGEREPTMTVHTKAAQEEIYDIFNETLKSEEFSEEAEAETEAESEDDDEFTSVGESTGTGRISTTTSEFGEETQAEVTESKSIVDHDETVTNTGWTDFDTKKDVPHVAGDDGAENGEETTSSRPAESDLSKDVEDSHGDHNTHSQEELVTPVSPTATAQTAETRFIPLPPEDYDPPTGPYRDPEEVAQSRLPFMTPIVEATESSLGAATARQEKEHLISKTPCPKVNTRTTVVPGEKVLLPSSPFQNTFIDAPPNGAVSEAQYDFEELTLGPAPPTSDPVPPSQKNRAAQISAPERNGPIITDKHCIPTDETIRRTILQEANPPLSSFGGYSDHTATPSIRRAEIRKYCKALSSQKSSSARSANGDRTSHTMQLPPILDLPGAESKYAVKRELGSGAFAPVYLVEHVQNHEEDDEEYPGQVAAPPGGRSPFEALKMEDPASAWEFYILRISHERLQCSPSPLHYRSAASITPAYELHLYSNECFLLEQYRAQGTLLDLVNLCAREHGTLSGTNGAGMDETLAMFFAVELLRTVQSLHSVGVMHGDLKADNVLVRLDPCALPASYSPSGADGWEGKGISLIDMGRGIDLAAFRKDVGFLADWEAGAAECPEMREARPWKWQADYWGLAGVLHVLLFGRYIETVSAEEERGGLGGKTWRLKEALKRYWRTEIWGELFFLLLNSGRCTKGEDNSEKVEVLCGEYMSPALVAIESLRLRMEEYLVGNGERGVGLRALIRRLEAMVGQHGVPASGVGTKTGRGK